MKRIFTYLSIVTSILCIYAVNEVAAAGSGGFRIFASDAEVAGKGYAFTGEADNPSAVFYNPAGLTQIKGENHFSIGGSGIQPNTKHTTFTGLEENMQRETFLVPHAYFVSDFGLDRVVFGVGSTSNWGLATKWNKDSFSKYSSTNKELENIDSTVTASIELNEYFSIGAGVIYSDSKFNTEKQVLQTGSSDGSGQLKGEDEGWGYSLSTLIKPNDEHQFGLIYRSAIDLRYKGTANAIDLHNNSTVASQKYEAIFGGKTYSTPFEADLRLPQIVTIGYSYRPNLKWRVNFDVDWTDWSAIETEYVTFPNESDATRLAILDALTRNNRDWKSTVSYQLGVEYFYNERFRLRSGVFFNPSPIADGNFDSSVPVNDVYGLTLGMGYDMTFKSTLDLAFTGMYYPKKSIDNAYGAAVGADLDGDYENFVYAASATVNHRF